MVPVIGSAFVQTWEQLLICRLLLGIGVGVKATTVPIFAAENSPASIRGALVMSWQMYVTFGVFLYVNNLPLPQLYLLRRTNKGDVRKPYCLEDRRYRVATAVRLRIHPRGPFASRHLLLSRSVAFMIRFAVADTLSRVSTMVHEKEALWGCLRISSPLTQH